MARRRDPLLRLTLFIASAQLLVAAIALPFVLSTIDPLILRQRMTFGILVAVFAGAGAYLVRMGTNDERAEVLGALFLLVATTFAFTALTPPAIVSPTLRAIVDRTLSLRVDAFCPYFFLRFASAFPRAPVSARAWRWFRRAEFVALAFGTLIAITGVLSVDFGLLPAPLRLLAPERDELFLPIQSILSLAILVALALRIRSAPLDERRRAAVLLWGIAIGVLPMLAWEILEPVVPSMSSGTRFKWAGWIIYPAFLSMAVTIPYAVIARQALDVSVIVRRAVDYAIFRYLAAGVLVVPALLLAALLFRHRTEPLTDTVSGTEGVVLIVLVLLSAVALRERWRVLHAVDRAFFREQYDAGRIKGELEDALVDRATPAQFARVVNDAIDRALHPSHCSILLFDQSEQRLIDPLGAVPALNGVSRIAGALSGSRNGLPVPVLEAVASPLHEEEHAWLAALNANLLFPTIHAGELVGILVIGDKQSGLAYSDADRRFVREVLQVASVANPENQLGSRRVRELVYEPAMECARCGLVVRQRTTACDACNGDLAPALLPPVVAGKFRIEARIGSGGMGVVYRAHDSSLDRRVALKTLPQSLSDETERLRREARAMAAVVHPHLASIYSLEMWAGRPILVCEYLAKGTLADRLEAGPLPANEAIQIGIALTGALTRLHRSGILHRDIKPSNIGFSEIAEPKLLDFGLARILYADESLSSSSLGNVAGTLRYVSPQILSGGIPTTDSDIWSLSLSLYEAVAGVHPYDGRDLLGTLTAAMSGKVPDIREFKSDVPAPVAEMFRRALSSDPRERPATATALMALLSPLGTAELNVA